eukprot:7486461-Alexandrium_andersonii.AAC.1
MHCQVSRAENEYAKRKLYAIGDNSLANDRVVMRTRSMGNVEQNLTHPWWSRARSGGRRLERPPSIRTPVFVDIRRWACSPQYDRGGAPNNVNRSDGL